MDRWSASPKNPFTIMNHSLLEYVYLSIQGKHEEAEPFIRKALAKGILVKHELPRGPIFTRRWLAGNLKSQGRLVEAEVEARQAVREAIALGGKESYQTHAAVQSLGEILLAQQRLEDAQKLFNFVVKTMVNVGISEDSYDLSQARIALGDALAASGNFEAAMEQYERSREALVTNQFIYTSIYERNPQVIFSHIMTGNYEEALALIDRAYQRLSGILASDTEQVLELRAMRGLVYAKQRKIESAYKAFFDSVLFSSEMERDGLDFKASKRWNSMLVAYADVCAQLSGTPLEKKIGIDAAEQVLMIVEILGGGTVRSAIGASGARAAATDPDLADLVRKEQDALKQARALEAILVELLAMPDSQENNNIIKLKTTIDSLQQARSILLDEIETRFPKYAEFVSPKPVDFDTIRRHLKPGESMLVVYPADNFTYIWVIPSSYRVNFSKASVGKAQLQQIVAVLRKSLTPDVKVLGDIKDFNLAAGWKLYSQLLKPVEVGLKNTTDLLVVAYRPLDQLPFSLLPTKAIKLPEDKDVLFSIYRKVPWLIREFSITHLPSASSVVTLRSLPSGDPDRKAFIGFGDPIFNSKQLAQTEKETGDSTTALAVRDVACQIRGIRLSEDGDLDRKDIMSLGLGRLRRLPDTADEIKSIAMATGADPQRDVYLGRNASEHLVKTLNLSNRRIIAFATHGLIPGDLDGLDQPALALSAPAVTGDLDDGLLTTEEILRLKLNADWIVLSACNTGAADGAGAEAVSGLGRSFFYAGSRAILVSMWPVETTSAKKLTVRLFQYQKEVKQFSRARALRKSILDLIESPGFKDHITGKIVASYAHPLFWAPFIIVGDSGLDLD
jgi:CHAT domain-containing protein